MDKLTFTSLEKSGTPLQSDITELVVSMGTCGIAAGGDQVYEYFEKEIPRRELKNIVLKKTGCLGLCSDEPNVIVRTPGKPDVLYGNITLAVAEKVLNKHITQNNLLNEVAMSFPSQDIFEKGGEKK